MLRKLRNQDEILLIKSEYDRLDSELRYILDDIVNDDKVKWTQQFDWKIEGDEFKEFMALSAQSRDSSECVGPQFMCRCHGNDQKEQQMLFEPTINRIDYSFPDYCNFGLTVVSLSSNQPAFFSWSAGVKEVKWAATSESLKLGAVEGDYEQFLAFENEKLKNVDEITVSIYVRPPSPEDYKHK